jgi:hypothetical protein
MEVCVKAKNEDEALEISRNASFDTGAIDLEETSAEELYNDPEDARLIQEFKDEGKYAEAEEI